MLPLIIGIDAGNTSAIALLEPAAKPRLLLLRVVPAGLDADAWAERAFLAFEAVAKAAAGRAVIGWWELTCPPPGNGWMGNNALSMRRGQLLGHASDAGLSIAGFEHVMVQTWTSILGVPRRKEGKGTHRIAEAERLVEMSATTLRGLGDGAVDGAESVLIGCARAHRLLGISAPKPKPARKPKAKGQAKGCKAGAVAA